MDSIIVCPFCQKGFHNNRTECPVCKESFNPKDWPVSSVYSPLGKNPKLILRWEDNEWSPRFAEFYIGREPDPDGLQLNIATISRKHARIYRNDNGVWFIDSVEKENEKKTSVKVNQSDICSETQLFTKDVIAIGPFLIEVIIDYTLDFIFDSKIGSAKRVEDVQIRENEHFCIGSDQNLCRILIDGAAPVHAILYYQKKTESWWITDCNSPTGTKVNGIQIQNEKLEDLDKITVAGVDILFDGDIIHVGKEALLGVDVLVQDVSVAKDGRDILKNISFYAEPGDFIGILGPSGCGKSSLIQRLVGLGGFDKGEVLINGVPYREHATDIQSITAYIPQDVALHDNETLKEEMSVFSKLHLMPGDDNEKTQHDALKRVHLDGKENSNVGNLSGGEKRRFSIALELLRTPHLLCLDEPTAGLDPATETDIMILLRRIANQSRTVLCSTHIMGNIMLFDKVLFLARGRLLFFGTPSELMNHFHVSSPLNLYQQFGKGTIDEQISRAEKESERYRKSVFSKKYKLHKSETSELPPHSSQVNFVRQTYAYLLRQFYDFICFRHSKGCLEFFKNFLFSSAFLQTILQPILVACVLKLACAYYFVDANEHKKLYFFFSIAVFWLGLNGAIRELVKERTPWRCLERLARISMSSYLLSKMIWVQFLCAIQVAVFSIFIFLPRFCIYREIVDSYKVLPDNELPFMWITVVVLYLICSLGAWIALAISAIFKKENTAIGWLPLILIPILFFSHPIISDPTFDDDFTPKYEDSNKNYSKLAIDIERFMPGFAPEVLLDRAENAKASPKIWLFFIGMLSTYMTLSMGIMVFCQGKNENQWEGR